MFFEMLLAASALYGYRRLVNRPGSIKRIPAAWWQPTASRKEAAGLLGEKRTQAKLREALIWCCGANYYLHDGPLIIERAPGTRFPTIEIDHLAVTPFGIFVFETKNWSGTISASLIPDVLIQTKADGTSEERKSPTAQNRTKLAFLRSVLPRHWNIQGVGVFASYDGRLSANLDVDLIEVEEIPIWLRTQRQLNRSHCIDVRRAVNAIRRYEDTAPDAADAHKRRIYQNSEGMSRII